MRTRHPIPFCSLALDVDSPSIHRLVQAFLRTCVRRACVSFPHAGRRVFMDGTRRPALPQQVT